MNAAIEAAIEALKAHPESRAEGFWYEAEFKNNADIDEIIESLEEDAAAPKLAIIPEWRLEQQRLMESLLSAVRGYQEQVSSASSEVWLINTHEIGWDESPALDITINHDPDTLTVAQWDELSQWVEESFPMTTDEISHGFYQTAARYFFED